MLYKFGILVISALYVCSVESAAVNTIDEDEDNCTCSRILRPVCGTDGVTYGNICMLECFGKQKAKDGPCDKPKAAVRGPSDDVLDRCVCARLLLPVCGSDGVTYDNDCMLECAGTTKVKDGSCDAPAATIKLVVDPSEDILDKCTCARLFLPVCGSDGVTYDNECMLECAGKTKVKDSACEEEEHKSPFF